MYAKKARGQERGKPLWTWGLPVIAVADRKFCGSSWDLGLKQNGLALAYNICLTSLCMSCEIILYNWGFVYSLFFILQLIILISMFCYSYLFSKYWIHFILFFLGPKFLTLIGLNIVRDCLIYLYVCLVTIFGNMGDTCWCFAYSYWLLILFDTETTPRKFLKYLE